MTAHTVTQATQQRRQPVQVRSRETVARILEAAGELIESGGVNAATTREIAAHAGVSVPSLYRFFADRDEVFDRLLNTELDEFDRYVEASTGRWEIAAIPDLVSRTLELFVAYNESHPVFMRLWFDGRVSPAVAAEVHERNRALAQRARSVLVDGGLLDASTAPDVLMLIVELGDRVLGVAFRDGVRADRGVIEEGCVALCAYLERLATTSG
jgi:AcrR family transcriptional regulator